MPDLIVMLGAFVWTGQAEHPQATAVVLVAQKSPC